MPLHLKLTALYIHSEAAEQFVCFYVLSEQGQGKTILKEKGNRTT